MNFASLIRNHHDFDERLHKLEKEVRKIMAIDISGLQNAAIAIAQAVKDGMDEITSLVKGNVDPTTQTQIDAVTSALNQEATALEKAVAAAKEGAVTKAPTTIVATTKSPATLAPTQPPTTASPATGNRR